MPNFRKQNPMGLPQSDRVVYVQGPEGPAGLTGKEGPEGPDGTQGVPGPRGYSGLQGPPGPQGDPGPAGQDGADGAQGAAGLSAFDISLIHGFVGTETQWLASLVGPKGDTGAVGPQGATGPKGDQGDVGPQGPKGDTGATGAQGIQGLTGPTGATGPKGDKGEQGPQGIQGIQGVQGPAGADGADGLGVPAGGAVGTYLRKKSAADNDTEWASATSPAWGSISGTLANQTDLNTALSGKEPTISSKLTAFNKNYETTASNIKMDGTQAVGTADTVARGDHVHPTDTSRAAATHVGATGTAHGDATTSVAGFMSSADKTKLDGVAAGANNYVHPTTSGNNHVPAGGSTGQVLGWSADGTAAWQSPSGNTKVGSATFTSGTTHTVTDPWITASTFVSVSPTGTKAGTWTVDSAAGSFTITSTASESGVTFDWGAIK